MAENENAERKSVSHADASEPSAGGSAPPKPQSSDGENDPPFAEQSKPLFDSKHVHQRTQPGFRNGGPDDDKSRPGGKSEPNENEQSEDKPRTNPSSRQDDKPQPCDQPEPDDTSQPVGEQRQPDKPQARPEQQHNDKPQADDKQSDKSPNGESRTEFSRQTDDPNPNASKQQSLTGWVMLCLLVVGTAIVASLALIRASYHPRTDDAEVFANFIGMAPQVEGPITAFPIHDNEHVKAGQLLFVVDERPYRYALERALSQQASLEGQIEDRERSIRSQISGIRAANATIRSSASNREAMEADILQAQADVRDAKAAVLRAEADRKYASDNLHRLEPLLAQQYVTVDQVDQARTLLEVRVRTVQQAESQVALAEARVSSNVAHFEQSDADVEQRRAQRDQAANGVQTLAPLINQREERAADVRNAAYNLSNCKVYAPFEGYVTNLTTSLGQYVHPGTQVFTMIDTRTWWTVANFRETQLAHVTQGAPADVFLLSRETEPLHGTVESIGYGVEPDPSVAGIVTPGLPNIQRTLSWVHLAARYPVRIRIDSPPPYLRIGQSAVAVVYGRPLVVSSGQERQ